MSSNGPDQRISRLVEVINSYPGIQTIMSCGGHKRAKIGSSQVPENEFYVDFGFKTICPTQKSWQSLNEIALCIDEGGIWERWGLHKDSWIKLTVCKNNGTTVYFRLYGYNVDPNKIADEMLERKNQTTSDYLKTLKPSEPYGYFKKQRKMTADELNKFLAENTGDE